MIFKQIKENIPEIHPIAETIDYNLILHGYYIDRDVAIQNSDEFIIKFGNKYSNWLNSNFIFYSRKLSTQKIKVLDKTDEYFLINACYLKHNNKNCIMYNKSNKTISLDNKLLSLRGEISKNILNIDGNEIEINNNLKICNSSAISNLLENIQLLEFENHIWLLARSIKYHPNMHSGMMLLKIDTTNKNYDNTIFLSTKINSILVFDHNLYTLNISNTKILINILNQEDGTIKNYSELSINFNIKFDYISSPVEMEIGWLIIVGHKFGKTIYHRFMYFNLDLSVFEYGKTFYLTEELVSITDFWMNEKTINILTSNNNTSSDILDINLENIKELLPTY
jgi:hypothetical protein